MRSLKEFVENIKWFINEICKGVRFLDTYVKKVFSELIKNGELLWQFLFVLLLIKIVFIIIMSIIYYILKLRKIQFSITNFWNITYFLSFWVDIVLVNTALQSLNLWSRLGAKKKFLNLEHGRTHGEYNSMGYFTYANFELTSGPFGKPWVFTFGLDSLSAFMVLLSLMFMTIVQLYYCFIESHKYSMGKRFFYYLVLLIINLFLFLCFTVMDFFSFFIFFEFLLFPVFWIIGQGTKTEKRAASMYFVMYTVGGSVCLLIALILFFWHFHSFNVLVAISKVHTISFNSQKLMVVLIFLGFAVKIPVVPLHLWLIEAHVESTTSGSMILAGLLLKLGVYGLARFMLEIFPKAVFELREFLIALPVLGIIHASWIVFSQLDMKRYIAYTSVAHMNFSIIGLLSFNVQGIVGSLLYSLAHGFSSMGLFLLAGVFYDRFKTRKITYFSGLHQIMPKASVAFFLFSLANMGFPGTLNFLAEFLIMVSSSDFPVLILFFLSVGLLMSAGYSLLLYNRLFFGSIKTANIAKKTVKDLTFDELCALTALAFYGFVTGLVRAGSVTTKLENYATTVIWLFNH